MTYIKKAIFCIFIIEVLLYTSIVIGGEIKDGKFMPDEVLKCPVLVKMGDGSTASGFYLLDDNTKYVYFITARHVLFKKDKIREEFILRSDKVNLVSYPYGVESLEPIEIEASLNSLYKKGNIYVDLKSSVDAVAIKMGKWVDGVTIMLDGIIRKTEVVKGGVLMMVVAKKHTKEYKDIFLANEILILGYPTSLGIKNYPQIEYDKPLFRRGIVAGKNDNKKTVIADCPTYYGNSGGPVIEIDETALARKFLVIGIVSEFIPFEEIWYNVKHDFNNSQIENSGYSVITPMDVIFELINNAQR